LTATRPSPPAPSWLEATVAYQATLPTNSDWIRHGLLIRLTAPFGRLPLAAFADAAFTSAPTTTVDQHPLTARVWPVGVGLAFRFRRPALQLSAGPRASLQIVDAEARAGDGHRGSARRYAAGIGLTADAAWWFSHHFGLVAAAGAEALVPRLQFAAGGPGATDLGWAQFALTAGLLVAIP
jgi:hypothetical protein